MSISQRDASLFARKIVFSMHVGFQLTALSFNVNIEQALNYERGFPLKIVVESHISLLRRINHVPVVKLGPSSSHKLLLINICVNCGIAPWRALKKLIIKVMLS